MTGRVLDTLVSSGLLTVEQLASVRESAAASGVDPGIALLDRGLVTDADVRGVLEEEMGVPQVDLSSYAPEESALALVPAEVARAHRVLPLFDIEGMLTVAIGEPRDVFILDAVTAETGLEFEPVLADKASVLGAIVQYYGGQEPGEAVPEEAPAEEALADIAPAEVAPPEPAPEPEPEPEPEPIPEPPTAAPETSAPHEAVATEELFIDTRDLFEVEEPAPPAAEPAVPAPPSEAPAPLEPTSAGVVASAEEAEGETIDRVAAAASPEGVPTVDLDVLAVADAGKVAVLVAEILELAVHRGANRIHLLPYKDDFFLVFRTSGRLEKVASAPLSMQQPLIDGFKNFARLGSVPPAVPALGRLHAHLADKDLVVTVSTVPTVAGQRMVISLAAAQPTPRTLLELGMSDAETRALHAMVERGRGMLLVCAPVAGGSSSTYYALLAHAAQVGKTAYSVERSIEYELAAVAQVLVNPGSPVGASSYFSAGMRQDTDVIAIDSLQSVEEVHLAIEAAGLGKLVIATYAAGDIVSGVRRMLDIGAEPNSLAAALTLGVGQRLVRTTCPKCAQDESSSAASKIPGAPKGLKSRAGSGCIACGKTGYSGVTGIFEVLPFTEPVRASIAKAPAGDEIAAAAKAAGMRPLSASGLGKVKDGLVSAEELNRVLRFA